MTCSQLSGGSGVEHTRSSKEYLRWKTSAAYDISSLVHKYGKTHCTGSTSNEGRLLRTDDVIDMATLPRVFRLALGAFSENTIFG